MNIQAYYQAIRDVERKLESQCVWLTSLDTRNGGVSGRVSEVDRGTAAKLLVDGTARLATDEEIRCENRRLSAGSRRAGLPVPASLVVGGGRREAEEDTCVAH